MDTAASLSADQALSLLNTYVSSFQDLWKFYITVVFALLGFVVSARRHLDRSRGLLIAAAFGCYAYVNLIGLTSVAAQRWALYSAARTVLETAHVCGPGSPPCRTDMFQPPEIPGLVLSHVLFDAVVIGAIVFLTWKLRLQSPQKHEDGSAA